MFTHTLVDVPLPADPGFPYDTSTLFGWQKGTGKECPFLPGTRCPVQPTRHLTRLRLAVSESLPLVILGGIGRGWCVKVTLEKTRDALHTVLGRERHGVGGGLIGSLLLVERGGGDAALRVNQVVEARGAGVVPLGRGLPVGVSGWFDSAPQRACVVPCFQFCIWACFGDGVRSAARDRTRAEQQPTC